MIGKKRQEENQRRRDKNDKERQAREYKEKSEKLRQRFGSLARFKTAHQRREGLNQIYHEDAIAAANRREEQREIRRKRFEHVQQRHRTRFIITGFIDPFYFGHYMQDKW